MSILSKIKELSDSIYNPQQVDDHISTTQQAPFANIQGSLGSYSQPRNQLQGGQLPISARGGLNVRPQNFGRIRQPQAPQPVFNPQDIFQEGLQADTGLPQMMDPNQYQEKEYLRFR